MLEYPRRVLRLAVRSEPHDLVFAGVDPESEVMGKRGIQKPERVRKVDLPPHFEGVSEAKGERRCRPFPYAVHRQHRGLFERGREKCACRVRKMMLGEENSL